jgi:hypothetical protein
MKTTVIWLFAACFRSAAFSGDSGKVYDRASEIKDGPFFQINASALTPVAVRYAFAEYCNGIYSGRFRTDPARDEDYRISGEQTAGEYGVNINGAQYLKDLSVRRCGHICFLTEFYGHIRSHCRVSRSVSPSRLFFLKAPGLPYIP